MLIIEKEYDSYSTKTLRLPDKILEECSEQASKRNLSLNKFVIRCLEYALREIKDNEEEETK